jgi:endonuclease YncB( thermonuclease family)
VAGCTDAGYRVDRVEVFDGDSFTARDSDGRKVEIRLFGIDAPERRQAWSRRSREALRELVRDRSLELRIVTVDRYERLVAEAWLPDGRSLAEAQVGAGHAWVYRRYTDDPDLLALEDEARRERRGLWSLPGHERMPPWEWRERARRGR